MISDDRILELRGVTKDFPGVRALDGVDFTLRRGEIHGLVGENGAGKSTLIKVIGGVFKPDQGEIHLSNRSEFFSHPKEAIDWGIGIVHQESNLIPYFTTPENIFLGKELSRLGLVLNRQIERETREFIQRVGIPLDIDLRVEVQHLGPAEKKVIEILRAINLRPKILILDEPTASLSIEETEVLFKLLRKFSEEGMAVVFVSHHLFELFEITDRMTVLRNGRVAGTVASSSVTRDDLIRMMIDRNLQSLYPMEKTSIGQELLKVSNMSTDRLSGIDFTLHQKEIVGFAGMVGAGRSELVETLFGYKKMKSGTIRLGGEEVRIRSVKDAIRHGLYLVPEDRLEKGIISGFSVKDNLALPWLDRFLRLGLVDQKQEVDYSQRIIGQLRIEVPDALTSVESLSGGNKQKVSFGKWSFEAGLIYIFDEPTEGIDVGSKVEIYKLMNRLIAQGAGIVLVSSELPELLSLSDRVFVMQNGRIVKQLVGEECTQERVLQYCFREKEAG